VTDGYNYTNFVLWDQDCNNLIGVSAVELMNKMIEVILPSLTITVIDF